MSAPESLLSHRHNVLSQIIQNDPDTAELVFELLVLTDQGTPEGRAAHADTLHECYTFTPDCYARCREKEHQVRMAASQ